MCLMPFLVVVVARMGSARRGVDGVFKMYAKMYAGLRRSFRLINTDSLDRGRWDSLVYWSEVVSAFLLAIATVATAYSIWQSTRWNGQQSLLLAKASIDRLESAKALSEAFVLMSYDANIWVEIEVAFWGGQTEILEPLMQRMIRDEFRVAVDAWLALDPLNNPDAPATPFEMEEYAIAAQDRALRLEATAEAKFVQGEEANRVADDYVLALVFLASVLFFSGISSKFYSLTVRFSTIAFATAFLAVGTIHLLRLPVQ